ncbi:hypothetical protein MBLNU457_1814t1 [Dothideomycetes sp. NU457]
MNDFISRASTYHTLCDATSNDQHCPAFNLFETFAYSNQLFNAKSRLTLKAEEIAATRQSLQHAVTDDMCGVDRFTTELSSKADLESTPDDILQIGTARRDHPGQNTGHIGAVIFMFAMADHILCRYDESRRSRLL